MSARLCKNCAHVGLKMSNGAQMQLCRVLRTSRPLTVDARASGKLCGPDGEKFAPKKAESPADPVVA
jgi:hypothetical protein